MKARLIYHQKAWFDGHFLMEMKIHETGRSERYPDGIKYRLICLDLNSSRRILMDNHHPKGPHVHRDDAEEHYVYRGDERLMEDFSALVLEHLGVRI